MRKNNKNKEMMLKVLSNYNNIKKYKVYWSSEFELVSISEIELGMILRRYSFFVLRKDGCLFCEYFYYKSYFRIYINKIEDDYYVINVILNLGDKIKNIKDFNSQCYHNNYYKVDQIGGLLKFLSILFEGLKYLESYVEYRK